MKRPVAGWVVGALYLFLVSPLFAAPFENQDTLKVLAIRVEFQPDNSGTTTGNGRFDLSSSSDPFQIDPPPHNRSYFQDHLLFMKNYFLKVSRGDLIIEGEVFPLDQNSAYQLDHPMGFYNPNTNPAQINEGLGSLFRDAILKADEDPAIRFSRYDAFIIFHAGVGRDIDVGLDETPQDIPSLFITQNFLQTHLGIEGVSVDNDSALVSEGSLLPETESQEGFQLGLNGMVVSNFGSFLGWPDLFSPDTRRSGVGRFALMDAGLFNGDGLLPALPDAWTRIEAGWETPDTRYQAQDDEFEIHSVLSAEQARVYKFPINDNEYFLLENRYVADKTPESMQLLLFDQRNEFPSMREVLATYFPNEARFSDSTGVLIDIDNPDRGLPGGLIIARSDTTLPGGVTYSAGDTIWYSTGVLIWHIDENVIAQNRAENRINADPEHRGVDVEEADGSQDIGEEFQIISGGAGSEIGTVLDSWYADNPAPVFINSPRNEFSVKSTPNSRSYYNRADSHIKLFNFSRLDSVMAFRATLNFFQANFPKRIDTNVLGKITSMKVADLDGNGSEELLFTTDKNGITFLDASGEAKWDNSAPGAFNPPMVSGFVTPPALFSLPDGNKALVTLSNGNGQAVAWGLRFQSGGINPDSLFFFQIADSITTFPLAVYEEGNPGIFWGSKSGKVYRVAVDLAGAVLTEIPGISEPIKYLHVLNDGEIVSSIIAVTGSGQVYRNGNISSELSSNISQPAGFKAVSVSNDGFFHQLLNGPRPSPEDGIHRFDSSPAAILLPDPTGGELQEFYILAGNNQTYVFNYNFTLRANFPVNLYQPAQPTNLFFTPLVGNFPGKSGQDETGIIVADPAGMISGFDLRGNLLPDFPLAVGDSILTSPALLDIDGDEDLELACVTASGTVYAWDFASRIDQNSRPQWPQLYGDAENRNLPSRSQSVSPATPTALLPAEAVYNWPNPNIENYTFIRYRLNADAEVSIKIYDLAGDLVKTLQGTGFSQTDNEVRWDLNGVQSGVYIGRVEARGAGKSEVRMIKIAVVK